MKAFLEKNVIITRIISAVFSYLGVLSVSYIFSLNSDFSNFFTGMYWSYNVGSIVVFLGGVVLCNRYLLKKDRRLKRISTLSGLLLAVSCVYGAYAHYLNDIFITSKDVITQVFLIIG